MANPTLSFRLYQLPAGARYVPRGEPGAPTGAPVQSTTGQPYNWRGYGIQDYHKLVRVADITSHDGFYANLVVSSVCDWQITKRFDNFKEALDLFLLADTPGTISVWHLSEPGEEDEADDFLAGDWDSLLSVDVNRADSVLPDNVLSETGDARGFIPSVIARGASGLVEDVRIRKLPSGGGEVVIGATCWGKQLQQTVISEIPFGGSLTSQSFALLVFWLAHFKAEGEPALARDLPDGTTKAERLADVAALGQQFRAGNGLPVLMDTTRFDVDGNYIAPETAIADFDATRKSVSPVGQWLITPVLTAQAFELVNGLRANGRTWTIGQGAHNMLVEFQRLAETSGLVFHTSLPYIVFDKPGFKPVRVWDFEHDQMYGGGVVSTKPQSTVWVGNHTDSLGIEDGSGRSLNLHFVDRRLVDIYGEIQTPFLSSAPRYQNSNFLRHPKGVQVEGIEPRATALQLKHNPYYYSDLDTIRLMQEQAIGLAVAEADNNVGNVELPYVMGCRYGSDWQLGDLVRLQADGVNLTADPLVVRQAGLVINAQGELRQQAVLGSRGNINPAWYANQYGGM